MNNNDKKQWDSNMSDPKYSTQDLRGRQSVRATFKLSEACIEAISILSAQLGIKQKSVFDHLMEDAQILKKIARELENIEFDRHSRIQKTYVVSRRSLSFLDMISRSYNAPRDALVEYSVQRLLPIIANEREKHEKRKQILAEISKHFRKGEDLLSNMEDFLGKEDPIYAKFEAAISFYRSALNNIAGFIEKGKLLEEFAPTEIVEMSSNKKR